ncbi:RadC family protein [Roseovarius salis]|uniref:RadC family protein n=1 Tax=Roseovarius salis TaxID=3376063 RepID=UPI0037CB06B3
MKNPASLSESPLPLFDSDESVPVKDAQRDAAPSYLKDHRKRLRDRFLAGGAGALPDYEMLELVLFRAIPRRDVKPLARALLERFGDFSGVLSAPMDQLRSVSGVAESVICELKVVEAAAHRLSQARIRRREVLSSWNALLEYCRATMAHRPTEQFRVFYLDRKNTLIADEEQADGTVDHVPVYPREIVKRALLLNASALILVHNHPSGDTTPSQADISMTGQVAAAAQALGIVLHDHVIIGRSQELSFRAEGYL